MRETESGPSTLKTLQVSWGDGQALKETHCGPEAVAQREELQVLRDGETSVACRDQGRLREGGEMGARLWQDAELGEGQGSYARWGRVYTGTVLTFSPSCSSSSWSRSMIVWINFSKKE